MECTCVYATVHYCTTWHYLNIELWCTHNARISYTAVHLYCPFSVRSGPVLLCIQLHCTTVQTSDVRKQGPFKLDIFWSKQNLVSCSVFIETYKAHTLLGTVIRLFIPASVHLQLFVLYSWSIPGARLASVEVSLTILKTENTDRYTQTHTHPL